jgi:hypothetical protein
VVAVEARAARVRVAQHLRYGNPVTTENSPLDPCQLRVLDEHLELCTRHRSEAGS